MLRRVRSKALLTASAAAVLGAAALAALPAHDLAWAAPKAKAAEAPAAKPQKQLVAMRRVSESQYRNTIADLYGADIEINGRFEPDLREGGLMAIGSAKLSLSSGGFEQYMAMGRSISEQVLDKKRRDKVLKCAPKDPKQADDACAAEFIRAQGLNLFRRPLSDGEVAARVALAHEGAERKGDFYEGLKLSFASLLTAPEFLFRMEEAEPDPNAKGELRLDGYTKAARLSYLIWDAAPDAELMAAAASGEIHTPEGLKKQVDRLVNSPKLERGTRAFFTDMLHFDLFESMTKDPNAYPIFSLQVADAAREQTLRTLVDHLITRKGDYRDILTTRHTFLNRPLAAVYNVPYLSAKDWAPYDQPADKEQAGVLTQSAFLSLFAHPNRSSPTKRGVALYEIFLCQPTPLPPPDVDFSKVQDARGGTIRERLLDHAENPGCSGCHRVSDPIGLALERFDGVGQTRTMENGKLIDVSATIDGKKIDGATGLGQVLHDKPKLVSCVVRNVYAYGVGRDPDDSDWELDFLKAQREAFAKNGYQFPALISAIATAPEFYRVVTKPAAAEEPAKPKIVAQADNKPGPGGLK